jgi:hypothetical protein
MTATHPRQPDSTTQAALDALRAWLPTDTLLHRLERQLRAAGADFDTIDERITETLGISLRDWHGYHAVTRAADRYQHQPPRDNNSDEGAPIT